MFFVPQQKLRMPQKSEALPGRMDRMPVPTRHFVNNNPLVPPFPDGMELALFGLGCFWGAERKFWQLRGVYSTQVGYAAGHTPNPTYKEVCSGLTGHNEVVRVVFDPKVVSYEQLLKVFFENHDPTQGMRQGNDVGTQYRSVIFTHSPAQEATARVVKAEIDRAGIWGAQSVTEIAPASTFYLAEGYHQEYFARNPNQPYCMFVVAPKVKKFRKAFADRLKK